MLRNNHSSRKRAASEEPDEYESEPEISISSLDNATKNEGMIGKRARIDNESTKTREDNSESFGKPFRNPMMIGNRNRNQTRQQNQALLIKQLESQLVRLHDGQRILSECMIEKVEKATEKWVDAGRQVIGSTQVIRFSFQLNHEIETDIDFSCLLRKNQSSEPSYNQFDSGTSWGYDTEDNPKCGATGEDKGDGCLEDSTFGPSEELPTANEIIGESIATRRYNADGLTDPSTYPKPPTFKTTEDLEIRTSYKPTKDVGWMMGQMGLE
ncbi:hypothetical protein PTTG_25083 [Puccinia triticina 1-1 BBBD Race 1]|uniref:Uncharacterized protein n=1 Tax=Puccinia triticina (isolate 1-1 / race 1 (BBBD)) TaxID=630390 RepID=A0A180H4G5_PUCT1|nr:hypothetical protein PTTG_25083 [Puccinia triticina 1-1 BBBD Race 1]